MLLREYLVKVESKLASDINTRPLQEILEQMDLYVGPKGNRMLRNVAAMMFCENPSKFFKRTQVEIVFFPEGRLNNPSNLYEGAVITGAVPQIIDRTSFRITIPCHKAAGNIIADIAHKDDSLVASRRGTLKSALQTALESALQSTLENVPQSTLEIMEQIQFEPKATYTDIANAIGLSRSWVAKTMKRLQEQNIIKRVGSDKTGYWEIIIK